VVEAERGVRGLAEHGALTAVGRAEGTAARFGDDVCGGGLGLRGHRELLAGEGPPR
jgi:hypothetical protein